MGEANKPAEVKPCSHLRNTERWHTAASWGSRADLLEAYAGTRATHHHHSLTEGPSSPRELSFSRSCAITCMPTCARWRTELSGTLSASNLRHSLQCTEATADSTSWFTSSCHEAVECELDSTLRYLQPPVTHTDLAYTHTQKN